MDLAEIKKVVIVSLFSDDVLTDTLVLKGGNAIDLVHGYGARSSIDVDLSMEADFADLQEAKRRLFHALREGFTRVGLVLFDGEIANKPEFLGEELKDFWGGYEINFKLIELKDAGLIASDLGAARRRALVVSPAQVRTFRVHISKFEYCRPKAKAELAGCNIFIYTPAMIVLEKIRALCQQMPGYQPVRHKRPRARDFYDIHSIVTEGALEIGSPDSLQLGRCIFEVKRVPLSLIPRIADYRDFHRQDWGSVTDSVSGYVYEFDYYFDFVLGQIRRLQPLWVK